jgi:NAD-dependent dihydropyrimidine dehydrogenase PreA subunit
MHFVCTPAEAADLVAKTDRFWVARCGCREAKAKEGQPCRRSRADVCLQFRDGTNPGREVSRAEAETLLGEARQKRLVPRPYRDMRDPVKIDGICLCCECCCDYFTNPSDQGKFDRGAMIEATDLDACTDCGDCVKVCYFGARTVEERPPEKRSGPGSGAGGDAGTGPEADGKLAVDREKCYGCGLCAEVCPVNCVEMTPRSGG